MDLRGWLTRRFEAAYAQLLEREIEDGPDHVAVIQDGNRRYARSRGDDATTGHAKGAETTEQVLEWCADLGVEELTLYALSTENFNRPETELNHLFDLIESKLREFADADRVHEEGVRITVIGDRTRLPPRVKAAVEYAEGRTAQYDSFRLNVALAYGGRAELLGAAREVAEAVATGGLGASEVDVEELEARLGGGPSRDVDLILRTGGDERTSNFLPWHADGNEAAVYFCTPYWPEFSKPDFLRAIRTYEAREESWRRTRARRAIALLRAGVGAELTEAKQVLARLRSSLPAREQGRVPETDPSREAD
jgi:tritrans,polycis-undecaprenyl-diphosphate synthase [geranylgeranyl-diphosphate specific]